MLTRLASNTHEEVYRVEDRESGLRGFIALHSTRLGPAAGGLLRAAAWWRRRRPRSSADFCSR